MSTLTPTPEALEFDAMVEKLSEKLCFRDQEKLGEFIRASIEKIFKAFRGKLKPPSSSEAMKYRVTRSSLPEAQVDLEVLSEKSDTKTVRDMFSISFSHGEFRGIPDGTILGKDAKNIPPLVKRQRISMISVRHVKQGSRTSSDEVQRKIREVKRHAFQLDVQLEPNSSI